MTEKSPERDAIVDEIHLTRRRIAEKFGGDITAILDDARKRQEASGRPVWQAPAKAQSLEPPRAFSCQRGGEIQE